MLRAGDQYLLQVAVKRAWLTPAARDGVLRAIAQSGDQPYELLVLLQPHVSTEDFGTLQRLSQAGGPGVDPRLTKGGAAPGPGTSFPGLADEGDVVIDLGAQSAPQQVVFDAPAQKGAAPLPAELLAFAKAGGKAAPKATPARAAQEQAALQAQQAALLAQQQAALHAQQQAALKAQQAALRAQQAAQEQLAPKAQQATPQAKGPEVSSIDSLASGEGDFSFNLATGSRSAPPPKGSALAAGALKSGVQAATPKVTAADLRGSVPHQVQATDDADSISTLRVDMSSATLPPALDVDATIKLGNDGLMATIKLDMSGAGPPAPIYPGQAAPYSPGPSSGSYPLPSGGSGTYPLPSDGSGTYPLPSDGSGSYPAGHGAPPPPATGSAPAPKAGGQIGPYRIERELARGGMGVVYIAHHTELDRRVALKVLLPGGQNEVGIARFQVEARATARLAHPNIVRIFDVGEDAAGHYFAMDLVEGESLNDTIKSAGKLEPRRAAQITKKLAEALSYAHTHAILHRDMKPANVLMRSDGEPVVTDFGLAKDVRERGLTVTGQVMGTPAYMPPEQAEGDSDQVDRRSDVYSIGATLFEMLTGRPPFRGTTPIHVLKQVLTDAPPRPASLVPGLDRDLETICLKCLEKEPAQRYLSARALGEDLGLWLRDLPIRAQPPTLGRRISSWGRRNRTLVWILSGVALVLLGGGVWTLLQVTEARVRAELEREAGLKQGRELASAELIASAQQAVKERRHALAEAPAPAESADAATRQAAEQERVARALEFTNAAQRWRAIAPDSQEAGQACFDAAMALGETTQVAKQWVLARHAFEQAIALEVDSERARKALAGVEEARTARDRARASEVRRLLSGLSEGSLEREGVVFGLVNEADAQTVKIVVERLRGVVAKLRSARRELFFESLPPGSEKGLDHAALAQALDALDAWTLGSALEEQHQRALKAATERLKAQANKRRGRTEIHNSEFEEGSSFQGERRIRFRDILSGQFDSAVGRKELVVVRAAVEALGWIGIQDGAVEAIGSYLAVDLDRQRAIPAGLALCRLGGDQAQQIVLASRKRFGMSSKYSRAIERALGKTFKDADVELDSETYEGYFQRGEQLIAKGQPQEALEDLTKALRLRPDETTCLHARATAYAALGDRRAAIRDYDRVLELEPSHAPALNNRAYLKKQVGNLKGAREDFERGIQEHPRQIGFWVGHAQTLLALGRPLEAVKDGDQAVKIAPQLPIVWHLRGVARMRSKDFKGALADLTQSIKIDQAKEIPLNYSFRADVYLNLKRPRKVLEDIERALEFEDKIDHLWFLRGIAHLQLGDSKAALRDMSKTLELNPAHPAAWANRGALRFNAGDLEGAHEDMTQALKLSPTEAMPRLNRAELRSQMKNFEGALEDVTYCLEKAERPGAFPYFLRAGIYLDLRRPKDAREDLKRFLELAPDHPKAGAARARLARLGE